MPNRRKPISFDTTLRNPERIPQFISILSKFENKIMDSEIALNLEAEIIRQKIFKPTRSTLGKYVKEYHEKFNFEANDQSDEASNKVAMYFKEWENAEPENIDVNKIIYLLKNTITAHKEKGWNGGWESRIHTQYNFLNELGLVRVIKNKKILISETGKMMIKAYTNGIQNDDFHSEYEQSAFLSSFAKYQTNNPYRSNTINVNFLALVLNVIMYLDVTYNKSGIGIQDLPFIIVWGDNDYKSLGDYIYKFRDKFGYNTSNELVYEYAMNLLDESTSNYELKPATQEFIESKKKDYKISKIMKETPDDVTRKLRYTMLISLRGIGNFIDINHNEDEKIKYILENYSSNKDYNDEEEYINNIGKIDSQLCFEIDKQETEEQRTIKEKLVEEWSISKEWNYLKQELHNLSVGKDSEDLILKYIKETARLEFLIAITIKKAIPSLKVIANYIADDQGYPFNTASGGNSTNIGADIDVYDEESHVLLEPTMSISRSFQIEHELPSIETHLIESMESDKETNRSIHEWFALFIAPRINRFVGNSVAIMKELLRVEIYPWMIDDFVEFSQEVESIKDYKQIREYAEKISM